MSLKKATCVCVLAVAAIGAGAHGASAYTTPTDASTVAVERTDVALQDFDLMGDTHLEVRNETNRNGSAGVDFEIWAYGGGSNLNPLYKQATLSPGQSWSGSGHNVGRDLNLIIKVDGKPKMRLAATNASVRQAFVDTQRPAKNSNDENVRHDSYPDRFTSNEVTYDDISYWVWRGADKDSGH